MAKELFKEMMVPRFQTKETQSLGNCNMINTE